MCSLENMRAAQGPQGSAACVEETVRNVNLDIASTSTKTAKNAAIVLIKTGSSSLVLSTCRLNILLSSIVLLLSLFWLNCGGNGDEVVVRWQGCDWLWLLINTMKNYVLEKFPNIQSTTVTSRQEFEICTMPKFTLSIIFSKNSFESVATLRQIQSQQKKLVKVI